MAFSDRRATHRQRLAARRRWLQKASSTPVRP